MPAGNEKCLPVAAGRQSFKLKCLLKMYIKSIALKDVKIKEKQGFQALFLT